MIKYIRSDFYKKNKNHLIIRFIKIDKIHTNFTIKNYAKRSKYNNSRLGYYGDWTTKTKIPALQVCKIKKMTGYLLSK